jgi:cytochrome d ubiquinol oxidase subunit II
MVFVLAGIVLYAVLAGADFGAGFWSLLAGRDHHGEEIRESAHHSMGPVWEANHVWLIFVLTVFWTAYSTAFGSIASTLAVPLFLAGLGIVMRGAAYALRATAATARERFAVDTTFSIASIVTPFALGTVVGAIATGRVVVGNDAGHNALSWLSVPSLVIGSLAVATSAYLASIYLAADAARRGDPDLESAFRRRAFAVAPIAGALALGGLVALHADAHGLYHELAVGRALPAVAVSGLAALASVWLVLRRQFERARYLAALAVASIVVGWALAQWPTIIPGLSIRHAAAPHDVLVGLIMVVAAGVAIVFPSLALLFRLALQGQFDEPDRALSAQSFTGQPHQSSSRLASRLAVASLIVGVGLLTFANAEPAHAVGVAVLLVFAVSGFAALVPALLPGTPPSAGEEALSRESQPG